MRKHAWVVLWLLVVAVVFSCGGSSRGVYNPAGDSGGADDGGDAADGDGTSDGDAIIADDGSASDFDKIPEAYIVEAKANLHVLFGRTSYGRQIDTGMQMLNTENPALYPLEEDFFHVDVTNNDLDSIGGGSWDVVTRTELQNDATINVVIWAWGIFVQAIGVEDIDLYLSTMSQLETEFPGVTFVYMTGHLSSDPDQQANLLARNEQIRTYCNTNGKILYDFAMIESIDPDGVSHAETGDDACAWFAPWCVSPVCISCTDEDACYHSNCYNCYLKGKAFWWLMARIAGWDGQ